MSDTKQNPATYRLFICENCPTGAAHIDWEPESGGDWMKSSEVWQFLSPTPQQEAAKGLVEAVQDWLSDYDGGRVEMSGEATLRSHAKVFRAALARAKGLEGKL
jgi:hypothetical protein